MYGYTLLGTQFSRLDLDLSTTDEIGDILFLFYQCCAIFCFDFSEP